MQKFSIHIHNQLYFPPVQLSSVDELVNLFKKPSLSGIKVRLPENEQKSVLSDQILTLFPTLSLVLEYHALKTNESTIETLMRAKFTECQHTHSRKPMFLSLKDAFSQQKILTEDGLETPYGFQTFKLIVEWHSISKKKDLKLLTIYNFDNFGRLSFHSFYNQELFFANLK